MVQSSSSTAKYLWWQTGIIYQVYPRSFQDSNDDGVGDLKGIIHRLDYLEWLGVQAIWISPFYPSPMKDFGYDISDYTAVDSIFGSMADFDLLVTELHKRGLKLILDFVPNHTSDQHPWFKESRSSKDNPKRDWYLWVDSLKDGSPPNNWLAMFGGSAWEWDVKTGQYYYHAFLKEQPDLNWRNPEVRKGMYDVMRFWLDKGVDGFRVDVMWHMVKDRLLRNNPLNPDYLPAMGTYDQLLPVYSTDQPEVHEIVEEMRELLNGYDERMMIGEIYLPIHRLVAYYGADNNGAHLPFNFMLVLLPWNAKQLAAAIDEYEGAVPEGGWPNWVLGNHDQPRITSRLGHHQSKVAAMLLLTLRGTPTIYYGDEIGMRDVPIPFEEVRDPQGLNMPDKNLSRDPARTPMQWDDSENAGFSPLKPWLRLDKTYKRENVQTQANDPHSMLSFYRRLIKLRQSEPSLMIGNYIPVYSDGQVISYIRKAEGANEFLVILNLTHRPAYFTPEHKQVKGKIILSTSVELEGNEVNGKVYLSGDEGIMVKLDQNN
jgi:alpha-glucosidase